VYVVPNTFLGSYVRYRVKW